MDNWGNEAKSITNGLDRRLSKDSAVKVLATERLSCFDRATAKNTPNVTAGVKYLVSNAAFENQFYDFPN